MDMSQKIGPFKLVQLCRTSHRELDNTPTQEVADRLKLLVEHLLLPIMAVFGNVWISSGYRSAEVNKAVGGSKTSAHMSGCALDIHFLRIGVRVSDVVRWLYLQPHLLEHIDQVIDEQSHTSNWLHLGILRPGYEKPRRQFLLKQPGKGFEPFPNLTGAERPAAPPLITIA